MDKNHIFKTSMRGFKKSQVLDYIEQLLYNKNCREQQLNKEILELKNALDQSKTTLSSEQARNEELTLKVQECEDKLNELTEIIVSLSKSGHIPPIETVKSFEQAPADNRDSHISPPKQAQPRVKDISPDEPSPYEGLMKKLQMIGNIIRDARKKMK